MRFLNHCKLLSSILFAPAQRPLHVSSPKIGEVSVHHCWQSTLTRRTQLEAKLYSKSWSAVCSNAVMHFRMIHEQRQVPCTRKVQPARRHTRSASTAEQLLKGKEDRYDGIIIDADSVPLDPVVFSEQLEHSMKVWKGQNKRGVWLKLDIARAALMHIAIAAGFDFHHAEPGHVVLTTWLPADAPNKLPETATHQVGVGAFVLNQKGEVLLVQEGHGILRDQGVWKLPTGLTNLGEDIPAAAEREVLEETGVRVLFDKILAIRQSHGHILGRSDLFFVCGMRLVPGMQRIVLQKDELAAADWHPLFDAEHLPIFQSGPVFKSIFACCKAYALGSYTGIEAKKLANNFDQRLDLLMHV